MTREEIQVMRARLRLELDSLNVDASVINRRRDDIAKKLDDLTIELRVSEMASAYPAYERELLKMEIA